MKDESMSDVFETLSEFARNFDSMKDKLTAEDLQVAMDSLAAYTKHVKEQEKQKAIEERREQERLKAEAIKRERDREIEEITCMDLPMDWMNPFADDIRTEGVRAESIPDGLIMSLTGLGCVDIEYIAEITGESLKDVIITLKGSIYQNPEKWNECFYKGWETADEYLSGNILKKLNIARESTEKYNGYFDDNVKALTKVLPPSVSAEDIYITLGSPWVPTDIIDRFIVEVLRVVDYSMYDCNTVHDPVTGKWLLPKKSGYANNLNVTTIYGTRRMNALAILEKTLNMSSIAVYEADIINPKKRRVSESETVLAIEKQRDMIERFQTWVWSNDYRKKRLTKIYEEQFGCVRRRNFCGDFLKFPGMTDKIELYPYQKDAAARIIFSPNTLLAHDVGSGKTLVMIAAGMEMKRMGLSAKNMYVVPNNILSQWERMFKELYPNADILCIGPAQFRGRLCEKVLRKIRDEEHDAVIIAASCFDRIPVSKNYYKEEMEEKLGQIHDIAVSAGTQHNKLMEKERNKIIKALEELEISIAGAYDCIYFDDLGITTLFVDEAHNYKNLPIDIPMNIKGISSTGSQKAKLMLAKVRCVQNCDHGKGVVFATGTPLSNSLTDAFVMQKYLQNGELRLLNLNNFTDWLSMFSEQTTEFEVDVDTTQFRMMTRFSKFHNIPELTSLLAQISDFHAAGKEDDIPECDGYTDCLVTPVKDFTDYLADISDRADMIRSGAVTRDVDNMLKITTDGRKAALDIRLAKPAAQFSCDSKVWRCAENIADMYFQTQSFKGTQLVFSDISTPNAGFNIYDELARCLESLGIPREEIEFIHNAENSRKKEKLISDMNSGNVRVLIGSTFKLGVGINVQERLIALHHLDVPWRPADMVQREGRILRQGNKNKNVMIFRYITKGSFDAYSWQLIERKQLFIAQILSGLATERECSDIDETVLNYAEVKALAIGNPLIKKRVETMNEINRLIVLQRKTVDELSRLSSERQSLPAKIKNVQKNISLCREDEKFMKENVFEYDKDERKLFAEVIWDAINTARSEIEPIEATEYRGFKIIVPPNLSLMNSYVKAVREGTYIVSMGDSPKGVLQRIDNKLDNLSGHLQTLTETFHSLNKRYMELGDKLTSDKTYSEQIDRLEKELEKIDNQLGVN